MVRIGANDVESLARYLAGLPFDAEVRTPPELRAALRALGQRLVAANTARRPGPRARLGHVAYTPGWRSKG